MKLLLLSLLLLAGCASAPLIHGIPNYAVVEHGVTRGGQPTPEGWEYIRTNGVKCVVKLNTWSECPETFVFSDGTQTTKPWKPRYKNSHFAMWVDSEPITLEEQLFGVNGYTVDSAVQTIMNYQSGGVFVHCEHGQDRTGLVIACWRVRACHWSKADSEKEMLAHGFHKSLLGLWNYWQDFKP
jgi:hypothetical protein